MDKVRLTKMHINKKTFYYAQFLKEGHSYQKSSATLSPSYSESQSRPVWLTVQLGHVMDGSDYLHIANALYTSGEGSLYENLVNENEIYHRSSALQEAVLAAASRYESQIRNSIQSLTQWLNSQEDAPPRISEKDINALQAFCQLKTQLANCKKPNNCPINNDDIGQGRYCPYCRCMAPIQH
ncbi:MAG: hypothetical protein JXA82_16480 [Sedimentisphaerales bacterium]|nr:hypothetical protein [Sedimentisphaerales bacterium]